MKRIEWTIAAVLLATMPLGVALAVEQAGVTAAVRGEVNLDPVGGEVAHLARSGEDVFLGDGISSGDASGLQLMLLDETIFTVGANTELTIDEFVYDPATGAGRMTASLTKGVFRFVAGKIARGYDVVNVHGPAPTISDVSLLLLGAFLSSVSTHGATNNPLKIQLRRELAPRRLPPWYW